MYRFFPCALLLALSLILSACTPAPASTNWMRDIDKASVECKVPKYIELATMDEALRKSEEVHYTTAWAMAGIEDCPFPTKEDTNRQYQTYAEYTECKGQAEALYWETLESVGHELASDQEKQQLSRRIASVAHFHCYPEGNLEDLPGAPEPSASPSPLPTPTPTATPTPTPTATISAVTTLANVPEGWQTFALRDGLYSVSLPEDWYHIQSGEDAQGFMFTEELADQMGEKALTILDMPALKDDMVEAFVVRLKERTAEEVEFDWVSEQVISPNDIRYQMSYRGSLLDCPTLTYGRVALAGKRMVHLSLESCTNGADESRLAGFAETVFGALEYQR